MSGRKRVLLTLTVTFCHTDFSVAMGGIHNVKCHFKSKKQEELAAGMAGQSTLAPSITPSSATDLDQVTVGGIYFSMFVAEHNLPFLAADHVSLCKIMLPDSKITSEHSSVVQNERFVLQIFIWYPAFQGM